MTIQKLLAIVAIAVATILWHGTPLPAAEPPIEPLSLWYDEPASKWIEALPVGQGRIGAMVFGGIKNCPATTPLAVSGKILAELATLKPAGLIFDIGSLKTPLKSGLQALLNAGCKVASLHPMYGPDTELLSGHHLIFVDVGCTEATAMAKALFSATMVEELDMGLDDHDRLIAYVLGLSHALNIAFFTALAESGEAAPKLANVSSTTFDAQLLVSAAVAQDNPRLYFEIQHLNKFGLDPLDALCESMGRIRDLVATGDEDGFVDLMGKGRKYLASR